jgi:hypothetical protein
MKRMLINYKLFQKQKIISAKWLDPLISSSSSIPEYRRCGTNIFVTVAPLSLRLKSEEEREKGETPRMLGCNCLPKKASG